MPSRDLDALDDQASVSGHREQQQYELSPAEFFVHELMIPEDQIEGIFRRCPQLTSLSVNKNLRPAVLALTSRGLSKAHVARALLIGPSLLSRHVTLNSGRVLDLFLDLGVRSAKLGKVVAARPEVLSLSVSKNLCTKVLSLACSHAEYYTLSFVTMWRRVMLHRRASRMHLEMLDHDKMPVEYQFERRIASQITTLRARGGFVAG